MTHPIPDAALDTHIGVLGRASDGNLDLKLDRLIGSHACIIANSGGGKSGLLRKILEQTHGKVQHIVLDVEDEFYSLRESFDYVIAGGEDGDVAISLDSATSLATMALEHEFSLVVQLNDLGADAAPFVSRFLNALVNAPKHLWHPVLVTIDELQRFASKDAGEATAAVKDLMFRGRKRGFTGLFASLRMAEIDPGVRGMVNNWMLGRVGQSLDRKTMAEQLGFSAVEARKKLAHMVERHFWAMGPALTVEPTLFKVYDVETTPVHAGQAKIATPPAPEALREILATLEVRGEAVVSGKAALDMQEIMPAEWTERFRKLAEEAGVTAARLEEIEAEAEQWQGRMDDLAAERDQWKFEVDRLHGVIAAYQRGVEAQMSILADISLPSVPRKDGSMPHEPLVVPPVVPVPESEGPPAQHSQQHSGEVAILTPPDRKPQTGGSVTRGAAKGVTAGETVLNASARKMLDMLEQIAPARVPWGSLAAMVGNKARGGNFNAARKAMRDSGQIVEEGDTVRWAAQPNGGMTREEARQLWKSVLTNPAPRMIDALECGPMTKEGLGAFLDLVPRGGNFNNGVAQLTRNGVAVMRGDTLHLAEPLPGES